MFTRRIAACLVAVAAAAALVALPGNPAAAAGVFTDDDGHPLEAYIETLAQAGLTAGCAPGLYCPDASVRRDEMAVFLVRAYEVLHGPAPAPATPYPFTDVSSTSFAYDEIGSLAALGITTGCGGTLYCPADTVARDAMAVFLARLLGLADAASPFTDTAGNFAEGEIGAIHHAGITAGCTATLYCPGAAVTRAEMAVFLVRALGLTVLPAPTTSLGTVTTTPSTGTITSPNAPSR